MDVKFLIEQYARNRNFQITSVPVELGAGAGDTTVVAAPAAGSRIVVLGGMLSAAVATTARWYHTAVAGGNDLTGTVTLAVGIGMPVAPVALPPATPLIVDKAAGAVGGLVHYVVL